MSAQSTCVQIAGLNSLLVASQPACYSPLNNLLVADPRPYPLPPFRLFDPETAVQPSFGQPDPASRWLWLGFKAKERAPAPSRAPACWLPACNLPRPPALAPALLPLHGCDLAPKTTHFTALFGCHGHQQGNAPNFLPLPLPRPCFPSSASISHQNVCTSQPWPGISSIVRALAFSVLPGSLARQPITTTCLAPLPDNQQRVWQSYQTSSQRRPLD